MIDGQPATGALPSKPDPRTLKHEDLVQGGAPLTSGGVIYAPDDIEHQHKVGICTAIHLTQNRAKANGKKYSADFQYLLQKKLYDGNWYEGSSIFNALRVGKNIGFLPVELWNHTTEDDRFLPYDEYVSKLQSVPDDEIERLKTLCIDKIPGYASVNVKDLQAIAKAVQDSEAGILCRYGIGDTWWLPSWLPKDINPLRKPLMDTSGHAIGMTYYDYTKTAMQKLANTWGPDWCLEGNADIDWNAYPMYEAWTILRSTPVIPPYKFTHDLYFGSVDNDNIELQRRLGISPTSSHFGPKTLIAVIKYQNAHRIIPAWGYVGPKTRASLNSFIDTP